MIDLFNENKLSALGRLNGIQHSSVWYKPRTYLSPLCVLISIIRTTLLIGRCNYHPYFIDEKIGAQRESK